jgi:hypothetical protein
MLLLFVSTSCTSDLLRCTIFRLRIRRMIPPRTSLTIHHPMLESALVTAYSHIPIALLVFFFDCTAIVTGVVDVVLWQMRMPPQIRRTSAPQKSAALLPHPRGIPLPPQKSAALLPHPRGIPPATKIRRTASCLSRHCLIHVEPLSRHKNPPHFCLIV